MGMKKLSLILLSAVFSFSSCDFLEVEPTDFLTTEQFYETDAQIENALTSVYKTLRTINSDYGQYFNCNTDEVYYYSVGSNDLRTFSHDATNKQVQNMWTNLYGGIKNCNFLLQGLEKNQSKLSEDVYRHAKGEALFLRGFYHFLLVQWYCHEKTGIPMSLEPVSSYEDTKMPLTKMGDIYEQIIKDMEEAEGYLLDQTFNSLGYAERVTVDAVDGILARVCLYAAGFPNNGGEKGSEYYYNKALLHGLKVTEMGHELVSDYKQIFKDECQDKYNAETIWEVGYKYYGLASDFDESNIGGWVGTIGIERMVYDRNTNAAIYDSAWVEGQGKARYAYPRLYMAYGDGDQRRDWNIPGFSYTRNTLVKVPHRLTQADFLDGVDGELPESRVWGKPIGKWRREDEPKMSRDKGSTSTNFPLLRYADVLLMIAEAYIELGESVKAAPYINQVRNRAIKNPGDYIVLDRIYDDGSKQGGYTFIPKITIENETGNGLKLLAGYNTDANGNISIHVLNGGSGYTTPPTIIVEAKKVTWEANKKVLKDTYFLAENLCLYKVAEDGTTTDVSPTHKIKALTVKTNPTIDAERTLCGVPLNYVAGPFTLEAPQFTAQVGKSIEVDVAKLVNINDQEAMRQFIRDERYRELCFESLRTMDLKRWGILVETIRSMPNDFNGNTEGIPAATTDPNSIFAAANVITNDNNYIPIPQTQLTLNPNLRQNPGF